MTLGFGTESGPRPEYAEQYGAIEMTTTSYAARTRQNVAYVADERGYVIVFDAQTLQEIKRLPMRKPVGKYNVWNKISREEGTSH